MHLKEYRICMPLTVQEYRIGQLFMIAKHSHEQSQEGEGVEVVKNEPCEHEEHGKGQFTEKRIHLSSKLPQWIRSMIPAIFYITEKAWNYYPYTRTVFIHPPILGAYNDQCHNLSEEELSQREVDFIDIDTTSPVMCSYKVVRCFFEVWGLQTKVEGYAQRSCRDVNLLGHRQAISWMDEWIDF
ncbi:PITC1-like protein [Mya arenaria]|uniref:PITC1-like protein n=1 Tax=Mya arenaria TaxID=6604 RepID=A0ABY7DKR4_MYAAR|nr:PITC1-like protein [Mya arenaria]